MKLPYEGSTSGERAIKEMQKILQAFGCDSFGHLMNYIKGELIVQFERRGQQITVSASVKGYAVAWLKQYPHTHRMRRTKAEQEHIAMETAKIAVYSILRDWIKAQVTMVETGVLSFEGAFLGQILLPSGQTVLQHIEQQDVLPKPQEQKLLSVAK